MSHLKTILLTTAAFSLSTAAFAGEGKKAMDKMEAKAEASVENPEQQVAETAEDMNAAAEATAEQVEERAEDTVKVTENAAEDVEKAAPMAQQSDLVDTAVAAEGFNTLVAAVKAADLVETLKGEGPFTVFAPTDAAFDALPDGTVASLLKPENKEKLQSVLTFHVISGKVLSTDLDGETTVATVQGEEVTITAGDDGVSINGANVVSADIEASNGVIHVIDAVILPGQNSESR